MTVIVGRGLGMGPRARAEGRLRREVVVPVPAYRRVTSLVGLSLVLVLVASAVDAVVWTYQSQRRLWRDGDSRRAATRYDAGHRHWAAPPPAVRLAPIGERGTPVPGHITCSYRRTGSEPGVGVVTCTPPTHRD